MVHTTYKNGDDWRMVYESCFALTLLSMFNHDEPLSTTSIPIDSH
jgi:hypothetical protein